MLTKNQAAPSFRRIETPDDLAETRLEATGYVFHGTVPQEDGKRGAVRAGTNLLHFARCAKLEKAGPEQDKIWFRTINIAKQQLDTLVGANRWKWCKGCE